MDTESIGPRETHWGAYIFMGKGGVPAWFGGCSIKSAAVGELAISELISNIWAEEQT